MNYKQEDGVNVFHYPIEDVFEKVKMTSSHLASGYFLGNPDATDAARIADGERHLFDRFLPSVVSDVFFHFSLMAKDIENAVKITTTDVDTPIIEPDPPPEMGALQPPVAPFMQKKSIVYFVYLPDNWTNNLLQPLDNGIEEALIYNMLMKVFKTKALMDLFAMSREKYDGDIAMIKSIINYRVKPINRPYRGF